jgi:DNA-binding response OmpR family regulator
MQIANRQALRDSLAVLVDSYSLAIEQIERTILLLNEELEASGDAPLASTSLGNRSTKVPRVDRQTLCVHWQGRTCFLGNTLLLRFFERLCRSPNRYVAYHELLNDVWQGQRDNSTIRGIAKRLRDRLTEHGMAELAAAIDGCNPGFYGLMLV